MKGEGVKTITKLWLLMAILAILTPIGIILPRYFRSRPPFGEEKSSSLWNGPMNGYADNGGGYILSALLGIAVIAGVVFLAGIFLKRRDR